jgi:hypothetical protein
MSVTKTINDLRVEVGTAPGQGATIRFELGGKMREKSMHPAAWKKAWDHFGGPAASNEKTSVLVENWLGSVLRPEDLAAPVLDVLWVQDRLPPTF